MPSLDRILLQTTVAGDLRAFERLVERYRDIVLRVPPGSSETTRPRTSRRTPSYRQRADVEDGIRDDKGHGPGEVSVSGVRAQRGLA
jgi:hypothetical protein